MGDMADDAIDAAIDAEDDFWNSDEDEDGWWPADFDPPRNRTCGRCGREKLHWEQREGKWKLCDERGVHKCSIKRIKKLARRLFNAEPK